MAWQWTPYTISLTVAAAILFTSATYLSWKRRHMPATKTGILLLLAAAEWILAEVLELGSTTLTAALFWTKVKYVGIAIVPMAWLVYMLQYAGREKWLTRRILASLGVVLLIILLLVFTNEAHGLMWSGVVPVPEGPFVRVDKIEGAGFWAFIGYSYMLVLIGMLVLIQALVRSRHLYRWQASFLLFSVLIASLVSALDVLGLNPFHQFSLTALALAVVGPLVGWTLYRLRRGDIVPVARGAVIEGMSDGVVVLDAQNRIVDLNPAAQRLIGYTLSEAVGQPVEQAWPEWPGPMEPLRDKAEVSREVVLGNGVGQRTYDLHISPMTDWRGRLISQVVVLRDITRRVEEEEQIKASLREKEVLLDTSEAIVSSLDLGQVLLSLAERVLDISGFHICAFSEWDREAGQVRILTEQTRAVWPAGGGETYRVIDYPTTQKVLTTGEPEAVYVDMDDPESDWMRESGLSVLVMLPLHSGEETVGLVEIGSCDPEFAFEEAAVLRCRQILQEAASWLKSPMSANPGDALLALAHQLVESSGGALCSISDWYRPEEEVRTAVEYGDLVWPPGGGMSYRMADWPSSIRALKDGLATVSWLSDPTSDPEDRGDLARWGARTLVVIPVLVKEEPVGLVELLDVAEEQTVSDDELRLWRAVASQAAVAMENARLYEQAQQEITERKRAEGQIKASLREKEVLLKEIHHRVKNNLQVMSSLLYLQSKNIRDEETLTMFHESQNRVRSMALVHDRLYQSQDLARIDFAEYLRSLANHLFRSYGVNSNLIKLKMNVSDVFLGVDTAIPCGLIVNELVSNSLKHAFPDGRAGEIRIELRWDDGQFALMVCDNGVGFPEDLGFRDTGSLGLQLVNTLVEQLEGTIGLDRSGGTAFKITFSEPRY